MSEITCHSMHCFPGHGDRYFCAHPQVTVLNSIVTTSICRSCPLRSLPAPENPRPIPRHLHPAQDLLPCLFQGPSKTESEALSCLHSNHETASLEICRHCDDFESLLLVGGGGINTWSVGVTTAPRPLETLERTLESLDVAGWSLVHVFAEPDSPVSLSVDPSYWHQRSQKLGAFSNWYVALTELVIRDPFADAYLLCQDDIVLCRDTRAYLEETLWLSERPQVVSPYCAEVHDSGEQNGFFVANAGWHTCGALALIFPNAIARSLLCDSLLLHHRRNGPRHGHSNIDSIIGQWCQRSGIAFLMHAPSLVEHIGHHSSLWGGETPPSPRRRAGSYLPSSLSVLDWYHKTHSDS